MNGISSICLHLSIFKCPNHKPTLAKEWHTVNTHGNPDRSMLNIKTKILRIIIDLFRIKK